MEFIYYSVWLRKKNESHLNTFSDFLMAKLSYNVPGYITICHNFIRPLYICNRFYSKSQARKVKSKDIRFSLKNCGKDTCVSFVFTVIIERTNAPVFKFKLSIIIISSCRQNMNLAVENLCDCYQIELWCISLEEELLVFILQRANNPTTQTNMDFCQYVIISRVYMILS